MSTRKFDELVKAMGMTGISKSQVSELCADIEERVNDFLERPLTGEWPYLWLDATYFERRMGGRTVSVAVDTNGRRIGPSEAEAEAFWTTLKKRGLSGVKLVISDAHEGLKAAIARVFGATWRRCRVHFTRNALAHVPNS